MLCARVCVRVITVVSDGDYTDSMSSNDLQNYLLSLLHFMLQKKAINKDQRAELEAMLTNPQHYQKVHELLKLYKDIYADHRRLYTSHYARVRKEKMERRARRAQMVLIKQQQQKLMRDAMRSAYLDHLDNLNRQYLSRINKRQIDAAQHKLKVAAAAAEEEAKAAARAAARRKRPSGTLGYEMEEDDEKRGPRVVPDPRWTLGQYGGAITDLTQIGGVESLGSLSSVLKGFALGLDPRFGLEELIDRPSTSPLRKRTHTPGGSRRILNLIAEDGTPLLTQKDYDRWKEQRRAKGLSTSPTRHLRSMDDTDIEDDPSAVKSNKPLTIPQPFDIEERELMRRNKWDLKKLRKWYHPITLFDMNQISVPIPLHERLNSAGGWRPRTANDARNHVVTLSDSDTVGHSITHDGIVTSSPMLSLVPKPPKQGSSSSRLPEIGGGQSQSNELAGFYHRSAAAMATAALRRAAQPDSPQLEPQPSPPHPSQQSLQPPSSALQPSSSTTSITSTASAPAMLPSVTSPVSLLPSGPSGSHLASAGWSQRMIAPSFNAVTSPSTDHAAAAAPTRAVVVGTLSSLSPPKLLSAQPLPTPIELKTEHIKRLGEHMHILPRTDLKGSIPSNPKAAAPIPKLPVFPHMKNSKYRKTAPLNPKELALRQQYTPLKVAVPKPQSSAPPPPQTVQTDVKATAPNTAVPNTGIPSSQPPLILTASASAPFVSSLYVLRSALDSAAPMQLPPPPVTSLSAASLHHLSAPSQPPVTAIRRSRSRSPPRGGGGGGGIITEAQRLQPPPTLITAYTASLKSTDTQKEAEATGIETLHPKTVNAAALLHRQTIDAGLSKTAPSAGLARFPVFETIFAPKVAPPAPESLATLSVVRSGSPPPLPGSSHSPRRDSPPPHLMQHTGQPHKPVLSSARQSGREKMDAAKTAPPSTISSVAASWSHGLRPIDSVQPRPITGQSPDEKAADAKRKAEERARLRIIADLQRKGITLSAIDPLQPASVGAETYFRAGFQAYIPEKPTPTIPPPNVLDEAVTPVVRPIPYYLPTHNNQTQSVIATPEVYSYAGLTPAAIIQKLTKPTSPTTTITAAGPLSMSSPPTLPGSFSSAAGLNQPYYQPSANSARAEQKRASDQRLQSAGDPTAAALSVSARVTTGYSADRSAYPPMRGSSPMDLLPSRSVEDLEPFLLSIPQRNLGHLFRVSHKDKRLRSSDRTALEDPIKQFVRKSPFSLPPQYIDAIHADEKV